MRASAFSIKASGRGCRVRDTPTEGTKLRTAWDRAMTGDWFQIDDLGPIKTRTGVIRHLREDYELEFEVIRRNKLTARYRCIGRWQGADFKSLIEIEEAINHTKVSDHE